MTTTSNKLTGHYVLDPARTRIGFIARHTIGPKVPGEFEEFTGTGHFDAGDAAQSRVELTIRADSIQTHNPQRDELLRAKFLHTGDHPTITFTAVGAQQIDQTAATLSGALTICGVTKPVAVVFERIGTEHNLRSSAEIQFTGSATIDRADWGVNWNAATGAFIGKKVTLEFDITVIAQP